MALLRDELRGRLRVVLASRMQQMDAEQAAVASQIGAADGADCGAGGRGGGDGCGAYGGGSSGV